jgi:hypothetical protein
MLSVLSFNTPPLSPINTAKLVFLVFSLRIFMFLFFHFYRLVFSKWTFTVMVVSRKWRNYFRELKVLIFLLLPILLTLLILILNIACFTQTQCSNIVYFTHNKRGFFLKLCELKGNIKMESLPFFVYHQLICSNK